MVYFNLEVLTKKGRFIQVNINQSSFTNKNAKKYFYLHHYYR